MTGEVTANLNTIPLSNLITIIIGIVVLLIVGAVLIKKFGISIGNVKANTYEYDQWCLTVNHHINEEIKNIDFELHRDVRRKTSLCTYSISKIGNTDLMCPTSRRAIFGALKEPFYDCITDNHFTRELAPTNFDAYKSQILSSVKDAYNDMLFESKGDQCDRNTLREWNEVEETCKAMIDEWLVMVMREVRKSCERKIKVYETEGKSAEKSKHWNAIFLECIEKNKSYIKNVDDRLRTMGVENSNC